MCLSNSFLGKHLQQQSFFYNKPQEQELHCLHFSGKMNKWSVKSINHSRILQLLDLLEFDEWCMLTHKWTASDTVSHRGMFKNREKLSCSLEADEVFRNFTSHQCQLVKVYWMSFIFFSQTKLEENKLIFSRYLSGRCQRYLFTDTDWQLFAH